MHLIELTGHRPYPLSPKPWIMAQTWNRLLFAHWPIPIAILQQYVPASLTIDTYDGIAWIGIVPFDISQLRFRGLPPIPFTSSFPEINVRTYVTMNHKPGVYFFSLDAANLLAVAAAKQFFHLPYYYANMQSTQHKQQIQYESTRIHKHAPAAIFKASYSPASPVFHAAKGTLDDWLTARYCLYTTHNTHLYRGEIHHAPWPLQRAKAEIEINAMHPSLTPSLLEPTPILHYVQQIKALFWLLEKM